MNRLFAAAAVGVVAAAHGFAQAPVPPPPSVSPKIDFSAPPKDNTVELIPDKTRSSQNPVRLTFRGWIYLPEGLSFTSPDLAKYPPEEKRLVEAVTTARKKGIEAIVPFWTPADQANVRKTVTDPNVSKGMTGFLQSIENSIFLAKILYGPYVIFLVQHVGPSLQASQAPARYAMKKVGDQFYLTDDLSADPVYGYFAEKYVRQLVARITGQEQ